jgi:hypothetical protein
MNLSTVCHTAIANASQSLGNVIGSHFIIFIMLTVTNFLAYFPYFEKKVGL